ncbi:MAG: cysteine--tRNA ligase [Gammaproteobacteria bacterium]|nr:cysteine--tRNA ligase [Gammaproteobacteria bacterium]MBT6043975.1 cysteine--tRNA ligase [Gammaproteobacteria bacterium]
MLQIYNTLTQQKETFIPIEPGKIRMYVCGITTYDYCHLGHGRMLVVFDVIVRFLRSAAYEVTYVRNITDIDDKIINRANEEGIPFDELTAKFIDIMHEDERALNILPPDIEPRATGHMAEIIHMIEILVEKGFAYPAANGDVYYSVKQFPDYTKLSHRNLDEMMSGARVDVEDAKNDPRDFALWKSAKAGEPGWDSPWGFGRPGWHIECSAMSTCCLGDTFDIHGGGSDLIFPHHENEIAQSEGATGKEFARVWIHNGPLRIDNEKMSKSLNNFFTIRDVLVDYPPEVIRYFLVSSHYRSPVNYSTDNLKQAYSALARLYNALKGLDHEGVAPAEATEFESRFQAAMEDDFNTPEALSVLFDLARELNRLKLEDETDSMPMAALLVKLGNILGVMQQAPEEFLQEGGEGVDPAYVDELISRRNQARSDKNWQLADEIRDELKALNVILEDKDGQTGWRIERD